MEYNRLGQTDLVVSKLCFGALTIGPLQRNMPIEVGAEIIRHALSLGVNFIDTAELYGTYSYIKAALEKINLDNIIIATKCYAYTKECMKDSLEKALRELKRDYIDIFLLHEQESALTLKGHEEALDYLWEAKKAGLVRAIGLSTHTVEGVIAGAECDKIEIIHPLVNKMGIGIKGGSLEDMLKAIEYAHKQGKGLYGMKPLGGGYLYNDVEDALKFAFNNPNLASVAVGMQSKEEVEMNILIASGKPIPQNLKNRVKAKPRKIVFSNSCEGCGSCAARCPNQAITVETGLAQHIDSNKCVLCGYCVAACPEFLIKII
ncbi:MAG TPA: 4Fe-4S binding protein [Clostridia bacterium]|nr:4Fe-4S binding protein [Clostridia bacterium]